VTSTSRGGTIQELTVASGDATGNFTWLPPREVEVTVTAEEAAGKEVMLQCSSSYCYSTSGDDPISLSGGAIWRNLPGVKVGTPTRIRVPAAQTVLRASAAGCATVHAEVPEGSSKSTLVLTSRAPYSAQVLGGAAAAMAVHGTAAVGKGVQMVRCEPTGIEDSRFVFAWMPPRGFAPRLQLAAKDPQAPPRRVALKGTFEPVPTIDLGKLRQMDLRTVDEHGVPVPGAVVAVAEDEGGQFFYWQDRFAVDMAGRASLLLDAGEWIVYAMTSDSHGVAVVHSGDAAATVRVVMRPLPTMRLRVVDAAGKPVPFARVQLMRKTGGRPPDGENGEIRSRIAFDTRGYLGKRLSGADGRLTTVALDGEGCSFTVKVVAGERESAPFELRADPQESEVVVR
jgi:hypothetical protein